MRTTFLAATTVLWLGCLDVPIIHVEPRPSDAGDAEASTPPADVSIDAPNPCTTCMRAKSRPGYGCGDDLDACSLDPQCSATIECALAAGCFMLPDQGAIVDCGTPCGHEAGLDISTQSAQLVLAVVLCNQASCGPICRGEPDASIPP